jgi:hypothetical protein
MKNRLFRVIWFISLIWVGLCILGLLNGVREDWSIVIIWGILSLPGIGGFVACYIVNGSFSLPPKE